MTDRGDQRSRRWTFSIAFMLVAVGCVLPVTAARDEGLQFWMITQPLIAIGMAINMVLQEVGRPRQAIILGYGLFSVAMLLVFGRLVVRLATETLPFPRLAFSIFGLFVSGALLVLVLTRTVRSYRATQSPPVL